MIAEELLLRRRESAERWKANNYAYYLLLKRALSCREEYKALRRERYRKQQEFLRSLEGFVSPLRGRSIECSSFCFLLGLVASREPACVFLEV